MMYMPNIIYGTHKMSSKAILSALQCGYLWLDTATGYNNESSLKEAMDESHAHPFIITKVNPNDFEKGIELSTCNHINGLNRDPSIVLLHSPMKTDEDNINAFKALRSLFKDKMIGVSNFCIRQIKVLISADCKPDVISLEFHPFYQPNKLVQFCKQNNIMITGYRSFSKGKIHENKTIQSIAEKHKSTSSQVVLKWIVNKSIIPIISSSSTNNLISNFKYDEVTLTEAEIDTLDNLNMGITGSTCMLKYCEHDD